MSKQTIDNNTHQTKSTSKLSGFNQVVQERLLQNNFTNISIETDSTNIEIIPTSLSNAKVELLTRTNKPKNYLFEAKVQDNALTIKVEKKKKFLAKWISFHYRKIPELRVSLPQKEYNALQIDLINGNIYPRNLHIADVQINSVNGKMEFNDLLTSALAITNVNGKVNLRNVEGKISTQLTNGSIHVDTNHLDRQLYLETVNGSISIRTDKEPTNAFIISSVVTGSIDVLGSNSNKAIIGEGENHINLKTITGRIRVY